MVAASNVPGYPFGHPGTLVGAPPQAPDWPLPRPVEHAFGVALRSRWSLLPAHPRGKHMASIQAWGYSSE